MLRFVLVSLLVTWKIGVVFAADSDEFFERKIRPVLVEHCYSCHSQEAQKSEGGLRVDSREALNRGGESGSAISPGAPEKSLLLAALKYESLEMPPKNRLPDDIVLDFEKWISEGAHDPREESIANAEPVESKIDFEKGRTFWSFQTPCRHELPGSSSLVDDCNPIDAWVRAELGKNSLDPAPRANQLVLLRRVTYDITGLPPTVEQIAGLGSLDSSLEYAKLVDELLAAPRFGEHWARMWLDIMRYGEDQAHIVGSDTSLCFPNSYLYRDWVIQAFNSNMPYDEFVRLQLAADIVTPDNPDDDVALGFIGLGPKYYRRNAPEVMADEWEDRIDVLSRGLLGLTVACARCHDHKYDPVGTEDYYALAGVFASTEMYNRPLKADAELKDNGQTKNEKDALHIVRDIESQNLAIMIRGDVNRRGPTVPRGFLTVLDQSPLSTEPHSLHRAEFQQGSGRMELANQIVSPNNPLTARVFVNRVWARLIGRPLVSTPSNFGSLGDLPSHPELLDDLAVRFVQNGWSLKWLCREIVTSATYQQSSINLQAAELDPENRWLARMNRKRLQVEQWRDGVLVAIGKLDSQIGGPSIDPSDPEVRRRTIYSEASRLKLNSMLALFDYPDPNTHAERRAQTITATQKLFAMNSPFMVQSSRNLASTLSAKKLTIRQTIDQLFLRLFARYPSPDEDKVALEFLDFGGENLEQLAHALMMSNEMMFLD
ncbi:MAG: PSD1 domain-containing protein [Planctomycetales bacterium]|nr:PSD1 domain-containing protein [Planctomycetales bacterium]